MIFKKAVFFMMFMACLVLPAMVVMADDLPQAPVADQSPALETEDEKYTLEEFDALPDDEKRFVYFNSPEYLPEGFDASKYQGVMHGDQNPGSE